MSPQDPMSVVRAAIFNRSNQANTPSAIVQKTIDLIEKSLSLPSLEDGKEAFKIAMSALVDAFPGQGYEDWLPTGTRYHSAILEMSSWWDKQTGSGL